MDSLRGVTLVNSDASTVQFLTMVVVVGKDETLVSKEGWSNIRNMRTPAPIVEGNKKGKKNIGTGLKKISKYLCWQFYPYDDEGK